MVRFWCPKELCNAKSNQKSVDGGQLAKGNYVYLVSQTVFGLFRKPE